MMMTTCPSCGTSTGTHAMGCGIAAKMLRSVAAPKPVAGLGTAVVVLLALVIAVDVVQIAVLITRLLVLGRVIEDPTAITEDQLATNDAVTALAILAPIAAVIVTGIVFVVWFYRARVNAEAYRTVPQRRAKGWAIGSWICPVVNLWFPKQMVEDVWSASDPAAPTGSEGRRQHGLVWAWWLCYLGWIASYQVIRRLPNQTLEDMRALAGAGVIEAAAEIAAAGLAILVVRRITGLQQRRNLPDTAL
jgi:Domain of unknown function (DUF4328)